jgi:hypothetical protein
MHSVQHLPPVMDRLATIPEIDDLLGVVCEHQGEAKGDANDP